ncbi:MAG: phosphoribosyltransferase family protein [Nocardioidaceae bacterium]
MVQPTIEPYADRDEAGRILAQQLIGYTVDCADVLVLGLPRGGAPVAAQVAATLGAALDVLVVRKLGLPGHAELAMGAIAGVGDSVEVIRNHTVLDQVPVAKAAFDDVYRREVNELRRRELAYRDGRAAASIRGRMVIVVDDGLATGSTVRAAVAAVRHQQAGPARDRGAGGVRPHPCGATEGGRRGGLRLDPFSHFSQWGRLTATSLRPMTSRSAKRSRTLHSSRPLETSSP